MFIKYTRRLTIFNVKKHTDYTSITDRFGDIGTRQNYNYYMRDPQRFTDLEIEATTNFIQSLITPKEGKAD